MIDVGLYNNNNNNNYLIYLIIKVKILNSFRLNNKKKEICVWWIEFLINDEQCRLEQFVQFYFINKWIQSKSENLLITKTLF